MITYVLTYLLLSIAIQLFVFVIAYIKQTDKLTDAAYGLGFVVLNGIAVGTHAVSLYSLISLLLIVIWACRLSLYLIIRIRAIGKDARFDGIRERKASFLKFFLLQGFAIVLISLPHLVLVQTSRNHTNYLLLLMGIVIFLSGLAIETIADIQKYQFKKTHSSWVSTGLWKYARHPNYFGEITVWWGLFVYSLGVSTTYWGISIMGPLCITILLRFVTGVPPLEKRYDQKFRDNKDYQKYKQSTRLLIPLP